MTTDKAMFYMGGSYGRRRVCYIRSNETDMQKLKFVKRDSFAPGFMVWAGVSYYGKTSLRIINKGVKVNADYYIGHVFKSFIEKDVPRLFPGRAREMVFHQDSASSHTARKTLDFLQKRRVQYITPSEWMQKRALTVPRWIMASGVSLKCRLQKRSKYTLNGLKRALKDEWNKLEQSYINKTLASWPKLCRMVYYCHGSQIEHLLRRKRCK